MGTAAASAGGRRTFSGTTGRSRRPLDGAADAAAESIVAAGPYRDYGPDGAADGLSRSKPQHADDTVGPRNLLEPGRRVGPMHGTQSQAITC